MDPIDHNIIESKGRLLYFKQTFVDAETGRIHRIRISLGTRSREKARKMRDVLYQDQKPLRSYRSFNKRRHFLFSMNEPYPGSPQDAPESESVTKAAFHVSPEKLLDAYQKEKLKDGMHAENVRDKVNLIKAFFLFLKQHPLTAKRTDARAFKDELSNCRRNVWNKPESLFEKANDKSQAITEKTIMNILMIVKSFYNYCKDYEYIASNPFEIIKHKKIDPEKKRLRLRPEIVATLRNLPSPETFDPEEWSLAIDLGSRMAPRRGELLSIKGTDVHLDDPIPNIIIITYKQKRPIWRRLPIPEKSLERLRHLVNARGADLLFPSLWTKAEHKSKKPGGWFGRVYCKAAKQIIPGVDFHTFRKYVGSELADMEVHYPLISAILGHKTKPQSGDPEGSSTTPIYIEIDLCRLKTALDKVR